MQIKRSKMEIWEKKSQKKWFIKNIKRNDIHNLLYFRSKMIGYTLLRKELIQVAKLKFQNTYYLIL